MTFAVPRDFSSYGSKATEEIAKRRVAPKARVEPAPADRVDLLNPTRKLEPATVPNRVNFVWVGNGLSQADLLTSAHIAARGGTPVLWTDRPIGALRSATSLHSSAAGSLDTHLPISWEGDIVPDGSANIRANPQKTLDLQPVKMLFSESPQDELSKKLDVIQECEGVGLGNPARRADAIRAEVQTKKGAIYMDFDRAETIRPELPKSRSQKSYNEPTCVSDNGVTYLPIIDAQIRPKSGCILPILCADDLPAVNNDLIANAAGAIEMNNYRKEIVKSYAMMHATPEFPKALKNDERETYERNIKTINDVAKVMDKVKNGVDLDDDEEELFNPLLAMSAWHENVHLAVHEFTSRSQRQIGKALMSSERSMNDQLRCTNPRLAQAAFRGETPEVTDSSHFDTELFRQLTFSSSGPRALERGLDYRTSLVDLKPIADRFFRFHSGHECTTCP